MLLCRVCATGEFTGNIGMTEPHAALSLADIKTTATEQEDACTHMQANSRISGGDHELSDNIVHLVLAKILKSDLPEEGHLVFVVPKYRLKEDGSIGERNDVHLTGSLHKLGYRGTTSTALSFGDKGECYGYAMASRTLVYAICLA